jgi:two-component system alkaline phosphatase synthesis response regulator PhoP
MLLAAALVVGNVTSAKEMEARMDTVRHSPHEQRYTTGMAPSTPRAVEGTNMTQRILVVDDDASIVKIMRGYLEQAGYAVLTAADGDRALQLVRQERPDLVVLDVMLPQRDGLDITRRIRADATLAATPIILLTARVEDTDKIIGLELGADDYITKPFNSREVVARVRALLRRTELDQGRRGMARVLVVGDLRLDLDHYTLTVDGAPVELTRTEFKLLQLLMEHPGYTLTRDELLEKTMGYAYEGMGRTLDTHIRNLRKKIEPEPDNPRLLQTVYGVGYRLTVTPP